LPDVRRVFAKRLSLALQRKRMTGRALAKILGVNEARISDYRAGRKTPGVEYLVAIADALDVSVDWLLGRIE